MKNNKKMLTASNVANELNISVKTLTNWYKWFYDDSIKKPENYPKLPNYTQLYERGPRMWTESDIEKLREFQTWLPRGRSGVMGEVSSKYWSKKGVTKDE